MATRGKRRVRKNPAAAAATAAPATVPTRWVKFVIGLFLLPPAWVLTQTFFGVFARAALEQAFWATMEFWFFSLGVLIWLVAFFMLPHPVIIYVFGHELTHAIWVWFSGGRVMDFRFGVRGGHVLSDRINTWIALAPYFFPIYSLIVIAAYGFGGLIWDMAPFRPALFMLLGATWAFHMTFTLWMIPKGQPDLIYGGTFFSLVIIITLNFVVLSIFLIVASPAVTITSFARELLQNAIGCNDALLAVVRSIRR